MIENDVSMAVPATHDSDLADLTVPELIERMIRDEDRVPRSVIDECARRGESMSDALRRHLDEDQFWSAEAPLGEWWLRLHAAMILGLMPDEQSGLLLVAIMRRLEAEQDDDMQDWLAGYWPALFRNKPDAVFGAVRELCTDAGLDWYIRANALDPVIAAAARQGEESLEDTLDWLARLAVDKGQSYDFRLWAGDKLLDFPRERHREMLDGLASPQSGFGAVFARDDVRKAYAAGIDQPQWSKFANPWGFYEPAAIAARQQRWAEAAKREEARLEQPLVDPGSPAPYVRSEAKIGRNEPCPCGSGLKYKKCCGANGDTIR